MVEAESSGGLIHPIQFLSLLCRQGAHEALHPCSEPYPTPNPTPQSLKIQATLYFSPPHLHFGAAARRNTVAEESEASPDSRRWNGQRALGYSPPVS